MADHYNQEPVIFSASVWICISSWWVSTVPVFPGFAYALLKLGLLFFFLLTPSQGAQWSSVLHKQFIFTGFTYFYLKRCLFPNLLCYTTCTESMPFFSVTYWSSEHGVLITFWLFPFFLKELCTHGNFWKASKPHCLEQNNMSQSPPSENSQTCMWPFIKKDSVLYYQQWWELFCVVALLHEWALVLPQANGYCCLGVFLEYQP